MSSSSSSSSSNSPCAACKIQRRKCTQDCVFAPYFPPENPHRFAYVHKVFGASNVAKLLNEIDVSQREDAVKSLAYEAEARLRDPVYGCVGLISALNDQLNQLEIQLNNAKKELASYIGPQALFPSQALITTPTPTLNNDLNPIVSVPFESHHLHQPMIQSQQQNYHFSFGNDGVGPSTSSFQNLMISPQQQQQPQPPPHHNPSFISQKLLLGSESENHGEGLADSYRLRAN